MAFMVSKDGKDALVDCSCGCSEGLRINVKGDDDGFFWISYISGNFYKEQDMTGWRVFVKKLKKIWRIIRNKDFYYSEIALTKGEFEEFREYINGIK